MKILFTLLFLINTNLAQDKIIYFVSDKSSTPIQMLHKDTGAPSGIISDVISLLEEKNYVIESEVLPFKRMIREMKLSKKDWISYGSKVWKGPQQYNLSKTPIIKARHVFFVKKDTSYHSFSSIKNKVVVLIRGFDYPGLEERIERGEVSAIYVKDHESAIKAVLRDRGIAFPEMDFRVIYHLKKHNIPSDLYSLHPIPEIIKDYDINLSFSKNFPQRKKDRIDEELRKLKKDKSILKIIQSYAPGYEN